VANRASPADPAAADLAAATKRRAVEALRAKLRPVLEALRAAAESEDDAAFDRALAEAQASLRDEAKKLDLSPDDPLVRAFAEGMSAALVNGAATGAQATTANRASGPLAWLRSLFSRR
jgi:soluble cytochrome b562